MRYGQTKRKIEQRQISPVYLAEALRKPTDPPLLCTAATTGGEQWRICPSLFFLCVLAGPSGRSSSGGFPLFVLLKLSESRQILHCSSSLGPTKTHSKATVELNGLSQLRID
uniref:Uncharacterized protein n=1 Tax=Nelumbo nucifera TaxID=4432 RepID=A0A822YJ03_NELNU|nr:TPA_asm: hypothetical protein HUJ06_011323 [Nelumbo nucifera]